MQFQQEPTLFDSYMFAATDHCPCLTHMFIFYKENSSESHPRTCRPIWRKQIVASLLEESYPTNHHVYTMLTNQLMVIR